MDRRQLLKALAAAPLAASVPAWALAADQPRRLVVLVYLYGGNDGFNTWVPYTDPLYYKLRPTIAIARDAVLKITDAHGFHPALAPLMPAWNGGELALVQGVGYAEATQQHYRDSEIAFTASDGDIRGEGWVSRAFASSARLRRERLDALAFEVLYMQVAFEMGPFRGERMGVVQVHNARELLIKRRAAECAVVANVHGRERLAADPAVPALALRTAFGDDPFGEAMRAAVELAAADPALPVIHVALNGLDGDKHHSVDTHWKQLEHHGDALARLANGLAALRSGLKEIGRWDDTLVATYDEFGRSPVENADRGTHHGLATTHFVMGGRVKGGLIGAAPKVERVFQVGGPAPTLDTRRLWTTVAERWWGVDASGLFSRRHAPLDLIRA
jgi:uncharacterized protein (DUF1501 family)